MENILLELSRDEDDGFVFETNPILASTSIVKEAVLLHQVSPPSGRFNSSKELTPSPVVTKQRTPSPVILTERTPSPVVTKKRTPSPIVTEQRTPSPSSTCVTPESTTKPDTPCSTVSSTTSSIMRTPLTGNATPDTSIDDFQSPLQYIEHNKNEDSVVVLDDSDDESEYDNADDENCLKKTTGDFVLDEEGEHDDDFNMEDQEDLNYEKEDEEDGAMSEVSMRTKSREENDEEEEEEIKEEISDVEMVEEDSSDDDDDDDDDEDSASSVSVKESPSKEDLLGGKENDSLGETDSDIIIHKDVSLNKTESENEEFVMDENVIGEGDSVQKTFVFNSIDYVDEEEVRVDEFLDEENSDPMIEQEAFEIIPPHQQQEGYEDNTGTVVGTTLVTDGCQKQVDTSLVETPAVSSKESFEMITESVSLKSTASSKESFEMVTNSPSLQSLDDEGYTKKGNAGDVEVEEQEEDALNNSGSFVAKTPLLLQRLMAENDENSSNASTVDENEEDEDGDTELENVGGEISLVEAEPAPPVVFAGDQDVLQVVDKSEDVRQEVKQTSVAFIDEENVSQLVEQHDMVDKEVDETSSSTHNETLETSVMTKAKKERKKREPRTPSRTLPPRRVTTRSSSKKQGIVFEKTDEDEHEVGEEDNNEPKEDFMAPPKLKRTARAKKVSKKILASATEEDNNGADADAAETEDQNNEKEEEEEVVDIPQTPTRATRSKTRLHEEEPKVEHDVQATTTATRTSTRKTPVKKAATPNQKMTPKRSPARRRTLNMVISEPVTVMPPVLEEPMVVMQNMSEDTMTNGNHNQEVGEEEKEGETLTKIMSKSSSSSSSSHKHNSSLSLEISMEETTTNIRRSRRRSAARGGGVESIKSATDVPATTVTSKRTKVPKKRYVLQRRRLICFSLPKMNNRIFLPISDGLVDLEFYLNRGRTSLLLLGNLYSIYSSFFIFLS